MDYSIENVTRICRPFFEEAPVMKASVFGDLAEGRFGENSVANFHVWLDYDGKPWSAWAFGGIFADLEDTFGARKVHLVDEGSITGCLDDPDLRKYLRENEVVIYERKDGDGRGFSEERYNAVRQAYFARPRSA